MPRRELEKNRLDLAYQRQLQFLNATLIIGAGSIIAYFGGLILNFNEWFNYSLILLVIILLSWFVYRKINRNLKIISEKISKIK